MTSMDASGEGAPIDDGAAIHYTAVASGTPVYSSDGVEVGTVREMLDNAREHIFDGVVFRGGDGTMRFADAPEVARTAERGVTLNLSADQAASLGPPETGAGPGPLPSSGGGMLGRLFGRGKR
jgi:hypothetical protein